MEGTACYVVFVHRRGEPNTRGNLAFQYTPDLENAPYGSNGPIL